MKKSMWPDWIMSLGPLAKESDALPTVPRGPAMSRGSVVTEDPTPYDLVGGMLHPSSLTHSLSAAFLSTFLEEQMFFNPIALRMAKTTSFGHSECNSVNEFL